MSLRRNRRVSQAHTVSRGAFEKLTVSKKRLNQIHAFAGHSIALEALYVFACGDGEWEATPSYNASFRCSICVSRKTSVSDAAFSSIARTVGAVFESPAVQENEALPKFDWVTARLSLAQERCGISGAEKARSESVREKYISARKRTDRRKCSAYTIPFSISREHMKRTRLSVSGKANLSTHETVRSRLNHVIWRLAKWRVSLFKM